MKRTILFIFSLFVLAIACAQKPAYKNAALPINQRVKDLLGRMTVEEKAGQLNQLAGNFTAGPASGDPNWNSRLQMIKEGKVGSMLYVMGAKDTRVVQEAAITQTRLGIPLLFGYDVIHGYKTVFPIPLAEACSWDLQQVEANAAVAARESAAAGLHWTFAPMCDVSNDPRWGRVMEGIGEDPWYGALLSAARVKGLQGNLDSNHILACVKHYAVYGKVEGGKEYNYVDLSRQSLWNTYMPPYKAAVEAGAATVMNAFTTFEGIPVSASKYLVTDVLKKKWGFKGFVVSDWASFAEMVRWGYASSDSDAAYKAFTAGSMMDMESTVLIRYIPGLIKKGKITMAQLDDAVGRILYYKFKLGLFDRPYVTDEKREAATILTKANRQQALEAAKAAVVLLKNNNQALPLQAGKQKIALVGYYANSKEDMFDFWKGLGEEKDAVTLYEGLSATFDKSNISFCNGYKTDGTTNTELINEAVTNSQNADVVVVNIGLSGKLAGESQSLARPEIPQGQIELLQALKKTGKPVIAIVSAGRPLVLTSIQEYADAILYAWILGTESGNAIAQVLSGAYNPSGKTVMSFPYATGQIPVYYNSFSTGRPSGDDAGGGFSAAFRDIPNRPLYPFGYGLSYTHFTYSNLQLSSAVKKRGAPLTVTVTITNDGNYDGSEVVQLYIHDIAASIVRPVKELKGFAKISLRKGESKQVSFRLTDKELSFYNAEGDPVLEPGMFDVFVGGNSKDVLKKGFELK